jgi:hypothetical protein
MTRRREPESVPPQTGASRQIIDERPRLEAEILVRLIRIKSLIRKPMASV